MTKVLIVYEMIPESTNIYVEDVTLKDLKWMKKCHGYYINHNSDDDKDAQIACDRMSKFLDGKNPVSIDQGEPFDIGQVTLIHTGFVM